MSGDWQPADAAISVSDTTRGSIPTLDKAAALVDLAQSTGFTPITEAFSGNPTLNNWEPRVGVAFDPAAESEDVDSRRLRSFS
jgi:hypothetical protein